jgi:cyanophycinase-like exopeptidase
MLKLCAAFIGGIAILSGQGTSTYQYFLSGDKADAQTRARAGILLAGGGKDVDAAFDWFLLKAAGDDVVVLRASGGDGYHDYFMKLVKLDSVETIVFRSAEASHDPFVLDRICKAEAIFLAGGDQWNYVQFLEGLLSRMRFMPLCAGACRSGNERTTCRARPVCVLSRA